MLGDGCHSELSLPMSLLWSEEVAEAWVCFATGTGLSCSHTHIPPFVSDRRLLPPAWPLAHEITGSRNQTPKGQSLPVPIAWVTRVQRAGQSVAVMVPGGCVGLWCFSGTPGRAGTSSSAAAKGTVTKDIVQEDCQGTEKREPAPALLGDGSVPKPTANPQYPRNVPRGRS